MAWLGSGWECLHSDRHVLPPFAISPDSNEAFESERERGSELKATTEKQKEGRKKPIDPGPLYSLQQLASPHARSSSFGSIRRRICL